MSDEVVIEALKIELGDCIVIVMPVERESILKLSPVLVNIEKDDEGCSEIGFRMPPMLNDSIIPLVAVVDCRPDTITWVLLTVQVSPDSYPCTGAHVL